MAETKIKPQGIQLRTKAGTFTRDLTTASGSQAITGVGFKPRSILFFANVGNICISSGGADNSRQGECTFSAMSATYVQSGQSANAGLLVTASSQYQTWDVSSYDTDGFTLSWSKVNSPTGTANINYIAFE